LKDILKLSLGAPGISSYSAASSSIRWFGLNSLGSIYCLNVISKKNGKGNNIPAIGIHVTPKQTKKYTHWKSVNNTIYLNGTDSTKVA